GLVLASTAGRDPDRLGNAEPGIAPSGCYPTADGRWIALVVDSEAAFAALVGLAGGVLDRFAPLTAAGRVHARAGIERALAGWTATLAHDDLLARLRGAAVRAAAIHAYRQAAEAAELMRVQAI